MKRIRTPTKRLLKLAEKCLADAWRVRDNASFAVARLLDREIRKAQRKEHDKYWKKVPGERFYESRWVRVGESMNN